MAGKQSRTPFDTASCIAMTKKMMSGHGEACDCTEMMSRMTSQAGPGCCYCAELMSQMMATCCGVQDETEQEPATEATQQA